MPLMGSFYVGTSGLQTSQNALNTTAHNLSNMETQGFVRQQVLLGDKIYNTVKNATVGVSAQQVGLGVTYEKVRQVRDYFLDQSYRRECGRSGFYDASYDAIMEVEDLLDELNDDASFNHALTNFWSAIEELAKTPDDTVVQRLLVQNAQSLLTNAQQVYQGLCDYQSELNLQIKGMVDEINGLGKTINELNDKIRKIEAGGIEKANDHRDARNEALDKLASLVNISYDEDMFGAVKVQVEGMDFVAADTVYKMNVVQDASTGFYIPYWEINSKLASVPEKPGEDVYMKSDGTRINITGARVFDLTQTISSEKNTDVGKLRAFLYIRGDKNANYTDIPVKPSIPDKEQYATAADYANAVKEYNILAERYDADVTYYNQTVAQSVCMNVEAEFDQLIHNIVSTVNKILENAADPETGYMCDDEGYPIQLFIKVASDGYVKGDDGKYYTKDADGNISWNYMEEITNDAFYSETLYSISNLQINPLLVREAGKMGFVLPDGVVDYDTANAFVAAFDADDYVLNPNVTTKCSLNTYYSNLVSQVANSGSVYKNISLSQTATVDSIDYSREQIQGVSSDEELSNMIRFQNAYNAASRYINVVDDMLEHIINTLAT